MCANYIKDSTAQRPLKIKFEFAKNQYNAFQDADCERLKRFFTNNEKL